MNKYQVFKNWVINEGVTLAPGETLNQQVCPYCNGGDNDDKSFSVTRIQSGYLFNCYRASCGEGGIYSTQISGNGEQAPTKKFTAKPYNWPTVPVSEVQRSWFTSRYGLSDTEIQGAGLVYCPGRSSYVWPIRDLRGYDVGVIDRAYEELGNNRKPKSITYWFNDVPKIYVPRMELFRTGVVYVVEDTISAIRGARFADTVACLSSNLTEHDASFLSGYYNRIVFALDRDAVLTGQKLAKKYNLLFREGAKFILLDGDMKDEPHEKVREYYE